MIAATKLLLFRKSRLPVPGQPVHEPAAVAVPRQAAARRAASRRLQRPAAQRPGDRLRQAEVHQQAGPQEAGRAARPQGLTGQDLVPESAHEVAQQQGAGAHEVQAHGPSQVRQWQRWVIWSFVIQKLIETITLAITIGNWHYSSIRVIGNVVDSITEPRKNNYNNFL